MIAQGDKQISPNGPGCSGVNQYPGSDGTCAYDTSKGQYLVEPSETKSLFTVGSFKIGDNHTGSLSYLWTRSNIDTLSAASPFTMGDDAGFVVSPDSPSYPHGVEGIDPTKDVVAQYRSHQAGPRVMDNENDTKRVMFELDGRFGAWRYDTAVAYNVNRVDLTSEGGFLNDAMVGDAIQSGALDPFAADPGDSGRQALSNAQLYGNLWHGKNEIYSWDGHVNRDIGDWFGAGPVALAFGAEARHERFESIINQRAGLSSSSGLDPAGSTTASRDVQGVWAELNVPLLDSLEVTGSARYDRYSQIGDSTNPKFSFRYQPIDQLVVRGSYSEGFRAPSLYEMYQPQSTTFSPGKIADPVLCSDGADSCTKQQLVRQGGNPDLSPEKSKNWTLGFVLQPVDNLTATVDLWWIKISDEIGARSARDVVANNPEQIVRPGGPNSATPISYIPTLNQNIGETETNGVDIGLDYKLPSSYGTWGLTLTGTYVNKYESRQEGEDEWENRAGRYDRDGLVAFRWKHSTTFSWANAGWNAAITNNYMSGYKDEYSDEHEHVSSYTTWDGLVGYQFTKGPRVTVGMLNVFNAKPPYTNQDEWGNTGYDARYADAVGRQLYARLNYSF